MVILLLWPFALVLATALILGVLGTLEAGDEPALELVAEPLPDLPLEDATDPFISTLRVALRVGRGLRTVFRVVLALAKDLVGRLAAMRMWRSWSALTASDSVSSPDSDSGNSLSEPSSRFAD